MKNRRIRGIVYLIVFSLCLITLGWLINDLYRLLDYQRTFDGLYIRDVNKTFAREVAYSLEPYGDWVLVNIRDMEYKEAVETCNHEVGHEIFAEICEKNISRCLSIAK